MRTSVSTEIGEEEVVITLSERNLLAMLAKLYQPGSHCEIGNNVTDWNGVKRADIACWFKGEKDDIHYDSGDRAGPGPMHPATEELISDVRAVLKKHGKPLEDSI